MPTACNAPVEVFPYLVRRIGKVQVMKALEAVHDMFRAVEYFPLKIITDGQSAGVIVSIRLTEARQASISPRFRRTFSSSKTIELLNIEHY